MFNTDEHRDNVFLLRLHLKGIGSSICRTLKSLQAKPENLTFKRKERMADLFWGINGDFKNTISIQRRILQEKTQRRVQVIEVICYPQIKNFMQSS